MTIYANLGVGWVLFWGILEKEKDALRERERDPSQPASCTRGSFWS